MPVQTSYPGVYVQEVPSGVRTIAGVSTSVAVFIGRSKIGPINEPTLCLSFTDFSRNFSAEYAGSDLARSVKLFFLNGGTECYVTRIAKDAESSEVTLKNISDTEVLSFRAKSPGLDGDNIRINITYNGQQPEATFNAELFRLETNVAGQTVKVDVEKWQGLSMDPLNPRYASLYLTQNSMLVEVEDKFAPLPSDPPLTLPKGYSQSGRALPSDDGEFQTALTTAFAHGTSFRINSNGVLANVDLSETDLTVSPSDIATEIKVSINGKLPGASHVDVTLVPGPTEPGPTVFFQISSNNGDVFIEPASTNDIAKTLMLGTAQGGLEVPRYSDARPVPNAICMDRSSLISFGNLEQTAFEVITINGTDISLAGLLTTAGTYMYQDGVTPTPSITGNNDGVREKIRIIANAINNERASNPLFHWSAEVWGSRLAIIPSDGGENSIGTLETSGADGENIISDFERNIRYYSLGAPVASTFQNVGTAGNDGSAPELSDYTDAYDKIDQEVDLFNLLILPNDSDHTHATTSSLWGPASIFCQEKRAFLLMDPSASWTNVQEATDPSDGVNSLRIGLVKDFSAIFFPRISMSENGLNVKVGPSGAIAGLMARIDGSRGIWKAPAGTEADIRGINGLEYKFSDKENGRLNPQAINTLRVFPNGIVNWGARTMDGDDGFASEYKYIPIRRTALFIEESLYRGLKWVVFEPNDEPLWAQIRLNVGAFMHDLFRQGAFQGTKKQDAYFVKCDSETTTQNDINLGIVNVWIGFAPLKPAEFVILYLQQMTGQIQV